MAVLSQLTPDNLRSWLQGMKPDTICGRAGASCDCPLARFLGPGVVVSNDMATDDISRLGESLPVWACCFVVDIDFDDHNEVTAERALYLLDGALAYAAREGHPA